MTQASSAKGKAGLSQGDSNADVTFKIIGLAMQVHNDLGPGHREEVYHNALRARLTGILDFEDEPFLDVLDELGNTVYRYKPDFIVAGAVIVEIKARSYPLTRDEEAQVIDYFAASDHNVALLINFGRKRMEWKRPFPPLKIQSHREAKRRSRDTYQTRSVKNDV